MESRISKRVGAMLHRLFGRESKQRTESAGACRFVPVNLTSNSVVYCHSSFRLFRSSKSSYSPAGGLPDLKEAIAAKTPGTQV